ncbi:TetR/AcrR family transcriptional regulator, partial [Sphingorhabdus sp.]|uniref:TetR/AcrR family transcriptional regulator n=1 Tax=Sphingorhabdus sp. TaxID=1902408 RepID=UPI003CC5D26B
METSVGPRKGRRPPVPHPQRERAHARPAILNAARQLFRTESYGGISVERIAATAQVTRHTLN